MKIAYSAAASEFADAILDKLRPLLKEHELVQRTPDDQSPDADLDVLISTGAVTGKLIHGLPKLQLIHTLTDGYELVDVEAATEAGIWVSYSEGDTTGNSDSVAEYTVLLLLAVARNLGITLSSVRDQSLKKPGASPALVQKTVCLVGPGSIGAKIAQRLLPFGVRLTAVDRNPSHAPKAIPTRPLAELKEAVADADFVVLCLRATKESEGMIDAGVLGAMKQGSMLVNIARGSLIDEEALYAAVESGHLRGAALDVVRDEPLKPDNPLMNLPQIFLTPHVAGQTALTIEGTALYAAEVIGKFDAGHKISSTLNEPKNPRRVLTPAK